MKYTNFNGTYMYRDSISVHDIVYMYVHVLQIYPHVY